MEGSTHAMWQDYAERKRAARRAEAAQVWAALTAAGVTGNTVLAVDFVHFAADEAAIEALEQQLSENYRVTRTRGPHGYHVLTGTTRPYGVTLSATDHLAWVDFMCDVAGSHGCTFSSWSLTAPALGVTIGSDAFEAG